MSDFGYGQRRPNDSTSLYNAIAFLTRQLLSQVRTAMPVQVLAVTNSDGVDPVGSVDVQPLVNQVDGNGNATPHGQIFSISYFRVQGGTNAIIADPKPGDVGLMVCADRDVSAVRSTKAQANPGSFRKHDLADGFYIGGFLNAAPEQWVRFLETGMELVDINGNKIEMTPAGVVITGTLIVGNLQLSGTFKGAGGATYAGNIETSGEVTAGTIHLTSHTHSGVQTGGGHSGPPVP